MRLLLSTESGKSVAFDITNGQFNTDGGMNIFKYDPLDAGSAAEHIQDFARWVMSFKNLK